MAQHRIPKRVKDILKDRKNYTLRYGGDSVKIRIIGKYITACNKEDDITLDTLMARFDNVAITKA